MCKNCSKSRHFAHTHQFIELIQHFLLIFDKISEICEIFSSEIWLLVKMVPKWYHLKNCIILLPSVENLKKKIKKNYLFSSTRLGR